MIGITIYLTAPDEETLRRAMDEISDRACSVDAEAKTHEQAAKLESAHERVADKHEKLAKRRRAVAKVLDDIADKIDHAKPTKVI